MNIHRGFFNTVLELQSDQVLLWQCHVNQSQQRRSNPEYNSPEEYFQCTVTIPFLDHLISDISSRFDAHAKQAALIQALLPAKLTQDSSVGEIEQAVAFYTDDLPNAALLDEEFHLWKSRWLSAPLLERPVTLTKTMKQCCPHCLPNMFMLLKLFATLPLSSCYCERSASALRQLNTYLRCTQTQERLSALALIRSNYNTQIDVDEVCKLFIQKYPRRLECARLLFQ